LKFMGLQGLTKVCLVLTSCLGCCGGRGEEWPAKAQMFVHHSLLYLAHKHHYMRDIPSRAPHLVCQSVALLLCRCGGAKECCARPFQLFDHFAVMFLVRNSVPRAHWASKWNWDLVRCRTQNPCGSRAPVGKSPNKRTSTLTQKLRGLWQGVSGISLL
jgi:hypothetical protein